MRVMDTADDVTDVSMSIALDNDRKSDKVLNTDDISQDREDSPPSQILDSDSLEKSPEKAKV